MSNKEIEKALSQTPDLTKNAITVLEKRYLKRDISGKPVEKPIDMFRRVALNIAEADKNYDKDADILSTATAFYEQMAALKFLPNSPTLMNAGRELQQLAACFVLPVDDSLEAIFEAVKNTALIHKSGGGTGFSFSRLRPKDDVVKTTKGVSSGPVSFMTVFDAATETIKQGGTRRGANMGILRVDHPDIMEFIYAKEDKTKLTNFNLSVGITEKFMQAVLNDTDYDLYNPKTGKTAGKLKAKEVFDTMVQLAWEGGDPGIVYLDRINAENPTPKEGDIESTNPCGEQPLLPYESCNLGSINLGKYVKDGKIDWEDLEKTIEVAVHFLDNVIDMNKYPIQQINDQTKRNRKIGLGLMGWADMLAMLAIPYNTDEATDLAEKVMQFIRDKGREKSSALAVIRGDFPSFKDSIYPKMGFKNMRNATITTIAPTGTISIIGSCSSGIEPYFAIAFYRQVMDNNKLVEVSPVFKDIAKREGFLSDELLEKVAETGTAHGLSMVPEKWQEAFVTSHEITPFWHTKMQAAFQKYTDNAVSKTVNFPNEATIEDVKKTYLLSYNLGCKGTTIYRDGSRTGQVLNVGTKEKEAQPEATAEFTPKPRPKVLIGRTVEMMTGCGKLYVTINQDENGVPFEVFTSMGKAGGCAQSQCEAIGRLISIDLRSGGNLDRIIKQLKGISCHMRYGFGPNTVLSCSDAVGKALEQATKSPTEILVSKTDDNLTVDKLLSDFDSSDTVVKNGACPDCGGPVEHVEGCDICYSCGYSHCS
ncbi:ribonucleoside-diphosphate reductase, adenosylcobalamin-dependent [Denitrovibrio acetiphilus DSM 12809]|uniref:Vitamin B12-dependent ribonucleotide reductase n=1 Tax=Denitrovibrio acetiphilus (strain DSM 12809 / NBRC 114555 / N2460) TaxID=522772 RepID=D4H0Z1_DENA2|nr:vitamin B12-dependent ribonucleotide reductase [Denitrovibrio acetiphilus]ADD68654.1 ribonucleoside-diphosphate reductase, adenosylcobalamin-dependent [Denitrovibrio acetiphilus DSM 12809]